MRVSARTALSLALRDTQRRKPTSPEPQPFSRAAISSFFIVIIAFIPPELLTSLVISFGSICQLTPNLSLSQPHAVSEPPSVNFAQYLSISSWFSHRTEKEKASLSLLLGPPLRKVTCCPSSSMVTTTSEPFGPGPASPARRSSSLRPPGKTER